MSYGGYGVLAMDGVPRLYDYKTCDEYFKNRKKRPKDPENMRPLRTDKERIQKHIKAVEDGYQLVLWGVPLITYKKDGTIELRTLNSAAAADFACYLLPSGIRATTAKAKNMVYTVNNAGYRPEKDSSLTVTKDDQGRWDVSGARQEYKRVAKRKEKAEIREKLKAFETWSAACLRMNAVPDNISMHGSIADWMEKILADPDNPEYFGALISYFRPFKYWTSKGHRYRERTKEVRELAYHVGGGYTKVPVEPHKVFIGRNVIWDGQ